MYASPSTPLPPGQPDNPQPARLVGFGLPSLLVAAVVMVALWSIADMRSSAHEAVAVDGQLSQLANDVATQTLESRRYEKDLFLNLADPHARADYQAKWQTTVTALDQAIAAFAATATTIDDRQQAANWQAQAAQYDEHFRQIAKMVDAGAITTPEAANAAFMPFKDNIRVLTESAVKLAERKTTLALATSTMLEATGARTTWIVGLLGAMVVLVTVGYGAIHTLSFRRQCIECDASLPVSQWFANGRRCRSCELRHLNELLDNAEASRRST